MKGVWKNYKLIGSLWVRGSTGPTQLFTVQIFQTQQTGLKFGEPVGFPHHQLPTNKASTATFTASFSPGGGSSDDLSHYAGKLPKSKLQTLLKSLLPANSTAKQKN